MMSRPAALLFQLMFPILFLTQRGSDDEVQKKGNIFRNLPNNKSFTAAAICNSRFSIKWG